MQKDALNEYFKEKMLNVEYIITLIKKLIFEYIILEFAYKMGNGGTNLEGAHNRLLYDFLSSYMGNIAETE